MTKPRRRRWPLKMYAVCYRSLDHTPGWVPYSGELFYYRDDAEVRAREQHDLETCRVMTVWVQPTTHVRRVRAVGKPDDHR
jgi:hypothetical protein